MPPPQTVLASYGPALAGLTWTSAPTGFSGASVWRGEDATGPLVALKAWPPCLDESRLAEIHRWMNRAGRLPFVPTVQPALDGRTVVVEAGRTWDVTRWMPGSRRERPTDDEVAAACAALAALHAAWQAGERAGPCPGVLNRLRLVREWLSAPPRSAGGALLPSPLKSVCARAEVVIARSAPVALRALEPRESVPLRIETCLRDVRDDHVLFAEGRVTGLVDFGALAPDHPAADLARLLGDYAECREEIFSTGLRAYRAAGGVVDIPEKFVKELAYTGALGSAINWLRRLYNVPDAHRDISAVSARLERLLRRIEHFGPV
jgi:Ser/Thr protein kinase RdoA (MazF antagonist)